MMWRLLLLGSVLLSALNCSQAPVEEPSGPIARFGTRPTIDGEFTAGEWDDAETVITGKNQKFRIKHDSTNLYLALDGGGGNLWFNKDEGLHVLHWSMQLGSTKYTESDPPTQILDRPCNYELWGLQNEPPSVIIETLAGYLAEHGWAANIAPLGPKMQSEFAISFDWLGVTVGSDRFLEMPGLHISAGLMLSRDDPETEEIMSLSVEERYQKYPTLFWPEGLGESHPLNTGPLPDTISLNPADFGKIWIDLQM